MSKYSPAQLRSMARTIIAAKAINDERYIHFVSMMSARTGFSLEAIERMIAVMAK